MGAAKQRVYEDGVLVERECGKCREMLPVQQFNKNASYKDGYDYMCSSCAKSKWHGEITPDRRIKYLLQRLRSRASALGIPFNLQESDIAVPTHCPVLGIPLQWAADDRNNCPSIDRVVPEQGYVKGNIIVVSYRANRIKNDATISELIRVADFYKVRMHPVVFDHAPL